MTSRDSKLVYTSGPPVTDSTADITAPSQPPSTPSKQQVIRVGIDRKRRRGKTVTTATGFVLEPASLAELAAKLKKRCGAGGTAKEGEIEIQGDHSAAVVAELEKLGYRVKKLG